MPRHIAFTSSTQSVQDFPTLDDARNYAIGHIDKCNANNIADSVDIYDLYPDKAALNWEDFYSEAAMLPPPPPEINFVL